MTPGLSQELLAKQTCGVKKTSYDLALEVMPDFREVLESFPDKPRDFTWDIKVHMLMPRQYPCIPNWHFDNIPRPTGVQDFNVVPAINSPMYLWVSGGPLTEFKNGYVKPRMWHQFTQHDEHRGTASGDFCWRAFIRATHSSILKPDTVNYVRRHCQVYLDAENYTW